MARMKAGFIENAAMATRGILRQKIIEIENMLPATTH
jgi:hypothetical protein